MEDLQSAQKPIGRLILGELPTKKRETNGRVDGSAKCLIAWEKGRVKNPEECRNHRRVITGRQEGRD